MQLAMNARRVGRGCDKRQAVIGSTVWPCGGQRVLASGTNDEGYLLNWSGACDLERRWIEGELLAKKQNETHLGVKKN